MTEQQKHNTMQCIFDRIYSISLYESTAQNKTGVI